VLISPRRLITARRRCEGKKIQTLLKPEGLSNSFKIMDISTSPYALVVDDDAIILMDACEMLKAAGFRFFEASTGDAAITLLEDRAESVTLLFSDVEMPGHVNGFGLARHVAQHWPWIEIVIASGRVQPGPDDMPAKATFIRKPFDHQMVYDHLRDTLPDQKQPEQLRQAV